jgi:2-alkyl-3-oxoalkanoate reductase
LRYGLFYGPGTHHDPDTGGVARQVREQKYPVIGSGTGVYSFIHVEDAAAATVAALESDPGVYNIVDDDPSEMRVWLPAFARFVAAPCRDSRRRVALSYIYRHPRTSSARMARHTEKVTLAVCPVPNARHEPLEQLCRVRTTVASPKPRNFAIWRYGRPCCRS